MLMKIYDYLKTLFSVLKFRLSLLIALSGVIGFLTYDHSFNRKTWLTFLSVLFLSSAGAAFNNYQDRHIDSEMKRTRLRPLPQGKISPKKCFTLGIIMSIHALVAMWALGGISIILLGSASLILYNGLYTPLKTKTIFAAIPGVICGMLPPLLGFIAAGGQWSLKIMAVMAVFGFWQLPHSWLIQLEYREDYLKSGIKSIVGVLSLEQLNRILYVWIFTFSVITLAIPLLNVSVTFIGKIVLALNAFILIAVFTYGIFFLKKMNFRRSFAYLNLSLLIVMLVILSERLFFELISKSL